LWYSIQNVKSRFRTVDKKNDILNFVEIKTVEFDHLDLPDEHTFFAKHRKKRLTGNRVALLLYLRNICQQI
jgi:hypothetical protein